MKISVAESILWTLFFPDEEYYAHIRSCGFRYIDFNFYEQIGTDSSVYMADGWQDRIAATRALLDSVGVRPVICHAPKGEPALDTEGILRRTMRSAECCQVLGIDRMVYHPGAFRGMTRKEFMDFNVEYVRRLLPTLEKTGVNLLLENVGRWDEPYFANEAATMLDLIESVNHPLYHACLDTGHLSLADGEQYETIVALGKHLMGLHIQDNYGSLSVQMLDKPWRQDLHLPPLTGRVNFDEVMRGLKEIDYQGPFNVEIESPRAYDKANKYAPEPRLRTVPLHLAEEYFRWVHDIAQFMLESYGIPAE